MPYRDFPPVYGPFDSQSLLDEEELRKLLGLTKEDTCADYYGHYRTCVNAVVETKGRNLRNSVDQIRTTVQRLRDLDPSKQVAKAIIVADSFHNRFSMHRKPNKQLWIRIGGNEQPVYGDTRRKDVIIEGWQPGEWGRPTLGA